MKTILNGIEQKYSLQYVTNDKVQRNYFPDFYLPETNEYIEIKGYFFLKDRIKMKLVEEQNPDKKIIILFKEDLIELRLLQY